MSFQIWKHSRLRLLEYFFISHTPLYHIYVSASNFNLILLSDDFVVKLLSTSGTCSIFSPPLDIILRAWNVLKIVSVVIAVWLNWPFHFRLNIFCSFQLQPTAAVGERFKRTNTVFFGSLKQSSCKSPFWFVNSFFSLM